MSIKRFSCIFMTALCAPQTNENKTQKNESKSTRPILFSMRRDTYTDKHWPGLCGNGLRQSPIQLDPARASPADYKPIKFKNYLQHFQHFNLINSGTTVLILTPPRLNITISGGPLKDEYILHNIHWHWKGSEHTVKGQRGFISEMHLVHRNLKYKNLYEALHRPDGVCVIAVLYKEGEKENEILKEIFKHHNEVKIPHHHSLIEHIFAIRELLPTNIKSYYTYHGSLTTPPCSEAVIWIVLQEYLEMSPKQINLFQSMNGPDGKPIEFNCRTQKPLNGRIVLHNT